MDRKTSESKSTPPDVHKATCDLSVHCSPLIVLLTLPAPSLLPPCPVPASWCRLRVSFAVNSFHATFPLLEKTDVNGPSTHPVFAYLKSVYPGDVTWNFHGLFVINEHGIPIRRFSREPYPEIDAFIGAALDDRDAHAKTDNATTADGQSHTTQTAG